MFTYIATAVHQDGTTRVYTDGWADPELSDIHDMLVKCHHKAHNDALAAGTQLAQYTFTFVHL